MGNICEFFSKNSRYEDEITSKTISIAKPIYNLDNSKNIPVGSPLYNDYLPSYSEVYTYNNINSNSNITPNLILLNKSSNINPFINPYKNDHERSMITGLLGGMLIEDILDGD